MTSPHVAAIRIARGEQFSDPIDMAAARSIVEHRLTGLASVGISAGTYAADPAAARWLAVHHLRGVERHTHLWNAVEGVRSAFTERGIDWLMFKGVIVEHLLYEQIGQRPAGDLDVLVAPHHIHRAGEALAALQSDHPALVTVGELAANGTLQHADVQACGVPVDLHFDYLKVGVATRQADVVWRNRIAVDVPGRGTVPTVSPELALVGLVLHQNKDAFSYLGPMVDIALLCERYELDWEFVRAFVAGEGLDVPFWLGLEFIAATLAIDVPVGPRLELVRSAVWRRIWNEGMTLQGHAGRAFAPTRQTWLPLTAQGRILDSVRELKRQVLPPKELFAIAGGADAGHSYLRRVTVDRLRRARALKAATS